ncbi:hypothetical protein JQ582_02285 [Bradyrhizobium japonicum]|uniref:hypothetical protein n=1 Tax=Bradyrhizobium japonicum TaxID=375 RepID=UPI001BABB2D6|nr:hypothetical protein [Bradyrhizobium japonicum]MBR0742735.1 hypothetical protein [Bradyrhizobium japonicum]
MGLIGRIITRTATAILSALVAKVAFEICYRFGWHPEQWLANLTMGLLGDRLCFWIGAVLLALMVWLLLETAVSPVLKKQIERGKMSMASDKPPPKHISEFKSVEELEQYMGDIISPNFPLPLRSPARIAEDAKKHSNPAVAVFDSIDTTINGVNVPKDGSAVGIDRSARTEIKNIRVRDSKQEGQ